MAILSLGKSLQGIDLCWSTLEKIKQIEFSKVLVWGRLHFALSQLLVKIVNKIWDKDTHTDIYRKIDDRSRYIPIEKYNKEKERQRERHRQTERQREREREIKSVIVDC